MGDRPWDEGIARRAWEQTWHLVTQSRWVKVLYLLLGVGSVFLGTTKEVGAAWAAGLLLLSVVAFFLLVLLVYFVGAPFLQRDEARADRTRLLGEINALEGRTEPMPAGSVSVRDSLERLRELRNAAYAGSLTDLALDALRNAAMDGHIKILGRRRNSPRFERIPADLWQMAGIDVFDIWDEDGSPGRTRLLLQREGLGYRNYLDLCVDYDALDRVGPESRKRPAQS